MLGRFGMRSCNPVSTTSAGRELSLDQKNYYNLLNYQSLVGSRLCLSRPSRWGITYAILELSRSTIEPSRHSFHATIMYQVYIEDDQDRPDMGIG